MLKGYNFIIVITLTFAIHKNIWCQSLDSASILAVVPFQISMQTNNEAEIDYPKIVAERVMTSVEQCKRFELIDRTDFETIQKEIAIWEGDLKEDFKKWGDKDLSRYGQRLKADFILTGTAKIDPAINLISGLWKATISITLKVISVTTNKIYVTESFEVNSGPITKGYNTSSEAIGAAMGNMGKPVKSFVDKYFPIYAQYIRTVKIVRNEMREAMINGGVNKGFWERQKLDILLVEDIKMINLSPLDIGDAEIIETHPEYSTIKVTSSKQNIEAVENKSKVLYFRSKD